VLVNFPVADSPSFNLLQTLCVDKTTWGQLVPLLKAGPTPQTNMSNACEAGGAVAAQSTYPLAAGSTSTQHARSESVDQVATVLNALDKTPPSKQWIDLLFSSRYVSDHLEDLIKAMFAKGRFHAAVLQAAHMVTAGPSIAAAHLPPMFSQASRSMSPASALSESPMSQSTLVDAVSTQPHSRRSSPRKHTPLLDNLLQAPADLSATDTSITKRSLDMSRVSDRAEVVPTKRRCRSDADDRDPMGKGGILIGNYVLIRAPEECEEFFYLAQVTAFDKAFLVSSKAQPNDLSWIEVEWYEVMRTAAAVGNNNKTAIVPPKCEQAKMPFIKTKFSKGRYEKAERVHRHALLCAESFSVREYAHHVRVPKPEARKWLQAIAIAAGITLELE
jgi:hypothetical protein